MYKDIVQLLCIREPKLAIQILSDISLKDDDPKIVRHKFKQEQLFKFNKEEIKVIMKQYDSSIKRLTKEYKLSRNAYIHKEKRKLGDHITIYDKKIAIQKFSYDYDIKQQFNKFKMLTLNDSSHNLFNNVMIEFKEKVAFPIHKYQMREVFVDIRDCFTFNY